MPWKKSSVVVFCFFFFYGNFIDGNLDFLWNLDWENLGT